MKGHFKKYLSIALAVIMLSTGLLPTFQEVVHGQEMDQVEDVNSEEPDQIVGGAAKAALAVGTATAKIAKAGIVKLLESSGGGAKSDKLLSILHTKEEKNYIINQEILKQSILANKLINELSDKIDKRFDALEDQLAKDNFDKMMSNHVRKVTNRVDPAWKLYEEIQDLLTLEKDKKEISAEKIKLAEAKSEDLIDILQDWDKKTYEAMFINLDIAFRRDTSYASIIDIQREILKNQYPFEHQIYDGMLDIYNYGLGIQAKLITLYSEYANYMKEVDPNLYRHFETTNRALFNNIEKQAVESKIEELDVRGLATQEFTLADGKTEKAYFVKQNVSAKNFIILEKSFRLGDLIEHKPVPVPGSRKSVFDYYNYNDDPKSQNYKARYDHSEDYMFSLPNEYGELSDLFKGAGKDIIYYLKTQGGLTGISDQNVIFINKKSAITKGTYGSNDIYDYNQTLVGTRDFDPDKVEQELDPQIKFSEIYDNNKSVSLPYATNTPYGDLRYLRIYVSRKFDPGKDTSEDPKVIVIGDPTDLSNNFTIPEGVTLDLSKMSVYDMDNKTIIMTNNSKIIGGSSIYSNLAIKIAGGSTVTMKSLKMSGIKNTPVITAGIGTSTLILEDENKATTIHSDQNQVSAVMVSQNGDFTITGSGSLHAEGSNGGAGITGERNCNITIKDTTVEAVGSVFKNNRRNEPEAYGLGIGGVRLRENDLQYSFYNWKDDFNGKITIIDSDISATSGRPDYEAMGNSQDVGSSMFGSTINLNGGKTQNMTGSDNTLGPIKATYKINVKTVDKKNAGTNNKVFFRLIGGNGPSEHNQEFKFSNFIDGNALERGNKDNLIIATKWVGPLLGIEMKNGGIDDWYCEYVEIFPPEEGDLISHKININAHFNRQSNFVKYFTDGTVKMLEGTAVAQDAWYTDHVNELVIRGIISKEEADNFNANAVLTNKQFATIFARMEGKDIEDYAYMLKDPDHIITREEVVFWVEKYIDWNEDGRPNLNLKPKDELDEEDLDEEELDEEELDEEELNDEEFDEEEYDEEDEDELNDEEEYDEEEFDEEQRRIDEYFADYPEFTEEVKAELIRLWRAGVFVGSLDSNGKIVFRGKDAITMAEVATILSRLEPYMTNQEDYETEELEEVEEVEDPEDL